MAAWNKGSITALMGGSRQKDMTMTFGKGMLLWLIGIRFRSSF
jgi:hypothetical protein